MMYARSFRYRVPSDKAGLCLGIAEEMARIYSSLLGKPLRRLLLVRDEGEEVAVEEIYMFDSWDEWRSLMEKSRGNENLSKLWDRFAEIVPEEAVTEEEWGYVEPHC